MGFEVSALDGATSNGFAKVSEMGLRGMITLRGDFADRKFKSTVKKIMGTAIPAQRQVLSNGDMRVAWMSPDELLLMVPHATADDTVDALSKALKSTHHLAVNVSDARAVFQISGEKMRDVIGKVAPVDLSPAAFPVGQIRRTRATQVPAAFYFVDDTTVELICFRSVAGYMFDLLTRSATKGSDVGFYR